MGKKAKARREATAKPVVQGPELRTSPNWPLLALSVLGMALAGYLSWTSLNNAAVKGCAIGSSCDIVLHSKWATLLGLPTAAWGFLTYALLAGIAFVRRVDHHWQYAWAISFFGIFYSAYLTAVSLFILGAACKYCLTSLALMTTIFAVVTMQKPIVMIGFEWSRWLSRVAPVAGGLILLLHLNYTGILGSAPKGEDAFASALADHLTQTWVKFYGASWCPHCQDQKAVFGVSARRLPYVECSPEGYGTPSAPICVTNDIKSFPTWIFKGNKRVEEVMTLRQLAAETGYPIPTPVTQ
jgi:uncharacterized membrane protein